MILVGDGRRDLAAQAERAVGTGLVLVHRLDVFLLGNAHHERLLADETLERPLVVDVLAGRRREVRAEVHVGGEVALAALASVLRLRVVMVPVQMVLKVADRLEDLRAERARVHPADLVRGMVPLHEPRQFLLSVRLAAECVAAGGADEWIRFPELMDVPLVAVQPDFGLERDVRLAVNAVKLLVLDVGLDFHRLDLQLVVDGLRFQVFDLLVHFTRWRRKLVLVFVLEHLQKLLLLVKLLILVLDVFEGDLLRHHLVHLILDVVLQDFLNFLFQLRLKLPLQVPQCPFRVQAFGFQRICDAGLVETLFAQQFAEVVEFCYLKTCKILKLISA